jgi:hypothetical protein
MDMVAAYTLRPTAHHKLWGGAVEILCFGRKTGDWSLRDETELMPGYPRREVVEAIGKLADKYRCRIYAPKTSAFNAQVVLARQLADPLIEGVFFRGVEADGVLLEEPGQAFALSSADCPTFVLWDSGTGAVVAAHAGRDSLVDRLEVSGALDSCTPPRDSVVMQAIQKLWRPGWPEDWLKVLGPRLKVFIACGIGPRHFSHKMQIPYTGNEGDNALVRHIRLTFGDGCLQGDPTDGCIDLAELIRIQCVSSRVSPMNIGCDAVDTFGDLGKDRTNVWHSHRRDGDGTRNLVLVIRRW